MDISKYIDLKWFLIAFAVGLFFVYTTMAKPTIVIKYPTPENSKDMIFKDDVDNCYKVKTKEVKCPKGRRVNSVPIQKTLEHFKKNTLN